MLLDSSCFGRSFSRQGSVDTGLLAAPFISAPLFELVALRPSLIVAVPLMLKIKLELGDVSPSHGIIQHLVKLVVVVLFSSCITQTFTLLIETAGGVKDIVFYSRHHNIKIFSKTFQKVRKKKF